MHSRTHTVRALPQATSAIRRGTCDSMTAAKSTARRRTSVFAGCCGVPGGVTRSSCASGIVHMSYGPSSFMPGRVLLGLPSRMQLRGLPSSPSPLSLPLPLPPAPPHSLPDACGFRRRSTESRSVRRRVRRAASARAWSLGTCPSWLRSVARMVSRSAFLQACAASGCVLTPGVPAIARAATPSLEWEEGG